LKILFLSVTNIDNINQRNIYPDLIRQFIKNNHFLYIVSPAERHMNKRTSLYEGEGYKILQIQTLNIQKTNIIEKGISTLSIGYLFKNRIKKYFGDVNFDLIIHSTPPITFSSVIQYYKKNYKPIVYLLLKDIFPQNAVDLGFFRKNSFIYKYFRKKEKELYKISDYIGCMSLANVDYLLKNNPFLTKEKVEINPNSIELSKSSLSVNVEIPNFEKLKDKVIFVYGGNLGKPQGIEFLLNAIDACNDLTNAFFLIIGSGTEEEKINRWFKKSNPINSMIINQLPRAQYDSVLKLCDVGLIFLNPDFTIPNYPSRILSYMENKMPILCATDEISDVGLDAEQHQYGLWCKSGDLDIFKNHIISLINDKTLRNKMGNNGYQFLKNKFDVKISYEVIMSHFTEKKSEKMIHYFFI
jgi:glycosyltransferase involved in cell wall biosynthesis